MTDKEMIISRNIMIKKCVRSIKEMNEKKDVIINNVLEQEEDFDVDAAQELRKLSFDIDTTKLMLKRFMEVRRTYALKILKEAKNNKERLEAAKQLQTILKEDDENEQFIQ